MLNGIVESQYSVHIGQTGAKDTCVSSSTCTVKASAQVTVQYAATSDRLKGREVAASWIHITHCVECRDTGNRKRMQMLGKYVASALIFSSEARV